MNNIFNNQKLEKYFLVDTSQNPCYAILSSSKLTEHEVSINNFAFRMNRSTKKYIKVTEW